ncbi:oligosaccharide flippase family protein [uncultured Shewanella sp.]|uniref:oligosaccharide flippase family protein n=1 Tax=uncultured Shewanella sp. TaxID=173975 RepID=UPI00261CFDF9|nr:oligosaccharide flippase family protein [uncultured Shewanella sp.]
MPNWFRSIFKSNSHQILGKSLFWLGSAQIIGRVVRLVSSIIIARLLTPENFGEVAIILTSFELISTPLRRLTTAPLVKLSDDDFRQALTNANKINWLSSIAAFIVMSLLSLVLSHFYQNTDFVLPMIFMACSYLILPLGKLHVAFNLRQNRMRVVGRAVLWQTLLDGVFTAILALIGFGIWAIIIPKVLVTFVWVFIHTYKNPLPRQKTQEKKEYINPPPLKAHSSNALLKFGLPVSISDIALAARQNIDYLLIGYFLGVEALGIYFFAFNTSLGISLGLIQSYGVALYSHLCKPSEESLHIKFQQSLKFILLLTIPLITLQASLSPWYVPLIYGEKWVEAGALPVFILLCLSGLVRPLGEAASQYLISSGRTQLNLKANLILTLLLIISISFASFWGLTAIACASLICYCITLPTFTYFLIKQQDKQTNALKKELPNDA